MSSSNDRRRPHRAKTKLDAIEREAGKAGRTLDAETLKAVSEGLYMAGETDWQRGFRAGLDSNRLTAAHALEAARMAREDAVRTNAMLTDALLESEHRADALLDHLDTLAMHAHRDILDDWVCVPACEWYAVMRQVFGDGYGK